MECCLRVGDGFSVVVVMIYDCFFGRTVGGGMDRWVDGVLPSNEDDDNDGDATDGK